MRPGKVNIGPHPSALGGARNGSVDDDGDTIMSIGGAAASQA